MSLHPDREELMAWTDDEVTAERAAEIAGHVATCAECRECMSALGAVSRRVSQWTVEPATFVRPPAASIAAPSSGRVRRRMLMWAAAAVFVIGIATTVRVDCAPAPTCERHTFRLAFMTPDNAAGMPEQARVMSPSEQAAFEKYWLAKPLANGTPRPKGQTSPRVHVDLFLDWQCPACRAEYLAYGPVFADIQKRDPLKLVVDYHDYPLNKRCNPHVPVEMHPAACEAAVAVRLAKEHGNEAAMIDWLFRNQESLTPETVRQAAATVGHIPDFDARAASMPMRSLIERDTATGAQLGVHSTPTCFINGVLARGENDRLMSPGEIRAAIEIELKRVK